MNKSVLLFSGGLDSVVLNKLFNPDILLVILHGNKYEKREVDAIKKLIEKKYIDKNKIIFDKSLNLKKFEDENAFIPNRNLFFITLATNYGNNIYQGSVYSDLKSDNQKEFFKKCESMFNYLDKNQTYKISAPLIKYTKSEAVRMFLKSGGNKDTLLKSYSCYSGTKKPCGECSPCFMKWVALENNNIDTKNYFKNNPWESKVALDFKNKIVKLKKLNKKLDKNYKEIENALMKYYGDLK